MKRAFSLIEAVFAIVILALVFDFFFLSYANFVKNNAFIALNQKLFDEEKALHNALAEDIEIFVHNLGTLPFSQLYNADSFFGLKSLKAPF